MPPGVGCADVMSRWNNCWRAAMSRASSEPQYDQACHDAKLCYRNSYRNNLLPANDC